MVEPDTVIQFIKAWNYANERFDEIKEFLVKHKKRGWKLLGSKNNEIVERKFKEVLEDKKNRIESAIWYGKGFAIRAECGPEVEIQFHQLMGVLIEKFSDISLRLIPEKLNAEFVGYLKAQLEMLGDTARHFWDIQEIGKNDPEKEKKALTIIQNFRAKLFEFERNMEPYLRTTELLTEVNAFLEKKKE